MLARRTRASRSRAMLAVQFKLSTAATGIPIPSTTPESGNITGAVSGSGSGSAQLTAQRRPVAVPDSLVGAIFL